MPKYAVTVDHPNRPKGDEIQVAAGDAHFVCENGDTIVVEMSKEDADMLRATDGYTIKQAGKDQKTAAEKAAEAPATNEGEGGE